MPYFTCIKKAVLIDFGRARAREYTESDADRMRAYHDIRISGLALQANGMAKG